MIEHIRPILDRPFLYEFCNSLIGANHRSRVLVNEYIRLKAASSHSGYRFWPRNQYLELAGSRFSEVNAHLREDVLHIPYTHLILECVH